MKFKARFALVFMLIAALSVFAVAAQDEEETTTDPYDTTFVQQAETGELTESELVMEGVPPVTSMIYEAEDGTSFGQLPTIEFADSFGYYLDSDESGDEEQVVINAVLTTPDYEIELQVAPVEYDSASLMATYEVVEVVNAFDYAEGAELDKIDDAYGDFTGGSLFLQADDELVNKIDTGLQLRAEDPDRAGDSQDTCIRGRTC